MAFYPAVSRLVGERAIITYVDESYTRNEQAVQAAVEHGMQSASEAVEYAIAFLWQEDSEVITSMWLFSQTEQEAVAHLFVYRNNIAQVSSGVVSGNAILVLGIEEAHRRKVNNLYDYLAGDRPELPEELKAKE